MAGNSELLTIHDATWEGNGNAWEMQKCIVCLDEHLLRQIDGKIWVSNQALLSNPLVVI